MLLVTFAVPHESRYFRRTEAAHDVRILHTGIGEEATRDALRKALQQERPSAVISTGFAGGLDPSLQVGDLIADSAASSPELLADLPSSVRRARIHTSSTPVDTPSLKARLHRETGAHAVDMETMVIAGECASAGVPLLVVRAISDTASDSIPVPLEIAWDMQRQAPRPFRLAAHLAAHPGSIGPLVAFLGKTNTATRALAVILSQIVSAKAQSIANS